MSFSQPMGQNYTQPPIQEQGLPQLPQFPTNTQDHLSALPPQMLINKNNQNVYGPQPDSNYNHLGSAGMGVTNNEVPIPMSGAGQNPKDFFFLEGEGKK